MCHDTREKNLDIAKRALKKINEAIDELAIDFDIEVDANIYSISVEGMSFYLKELS
jgi:frataxin-like iron-binding protein CyaY